MDRLVILTLSCFLFSGLAAGANPPDALALLRGAAQSRLALQPGKIIAVISQHDDDKNPINLMIEFNGDKRTIYQICDNHVIGQSEQDKFESLPPDKRLSIGKMVKTETRSAWDGLQYASYSKGEREAWYKDHKNGTANLVFDPRIIGITDEYSITGTVPLCLRLDVIKSTNVDGPEVIRGSLTWHVTVIDNYDQKFEYWIADTAPFRVHRVKDSGGQNSRKFVVTESEFDPKAPESPLPMIVTSRTYRADGSLPSPKQRRKFEAIKCDLGIPVSPTVGTLASLNLPVGTRVGDAKIEKQLGYWDGSNVSPTYVARVESEPTPQPLPAPSRPNWAVIGGCVGAALAVILGIVYFRRRRAFQS